MVSGCGNTGVCLPYIADPVAMTFADSDFTAVGGAIVYDDNFINRMRLAEDGFQCAE